MGGLFAHRTFVTRLRAPSRSIPSSAAAPLTISPTCLSGVIGVHPIRGHARLQKASKRTIGREKLSFISSEPIPTSSISSRCRPQTRSRVILVSICPLGAVCPPPVRTRFFPTGLSALTRVVPYSSVIRSFDSGRQPRSQRDFQNASLLIPAYRFRQRFERSKRAELM